MRTVVIIASANIGVVYVRPAALFFAAMGGGGDWTTASVGFGVGAIVAKLTQ